MIYDETVFALEDQSLELVAAVRNSPVYQDYLACEKQLAKSTEARALKSDFLAQKAAFEKIEAYGKFAPGFSKQQRALRVAKRKLDLQPEVAAFKLAETDLQQVLDEVCQNLAGLISKEIKVDAGNPFFETKGHHCKGNCHG